MKKTIKITIALLVYALLTYIVMQMVYYSSTYPDGSDTMFHLYRGDLILQSIKDGNWFPLLDPNWYNGAEIMRFWAPFPTYVMAFCQFIAGGDLFQGYIVFVGLMFFFGAVPWLMIGVSRNRIGLGAFLGAIWFFMPNNLYALFVEGNLARTICMIFLPLFVHYLHGYLYENKWKSLIKMMFCSLFMVLCHLGYAGMIFLAVLVYLVCYVILYRNFRKAVHIILGIAFTFLWTGIWTIASLHGGITSTDSSQVMASFFQDFWVSVNPFYRSEYGLGEFYFGFAAFVLILFGILFGRRKTASGFVSGLLILLATTTSLYPIISRLPGSQYLWMLRFISIALCFVLFSFLIWDTLKKPFRIIICLLLILDIVPSLSLLYGSFTGVPVEERMDEFSEDTLITKAKEITNQRIALLDASTLEAQGAYAVSYYKTITATSFGAGWQGANTATNIVQLNQAMDDGRYLYLFDRCLELGNDTVLISVNVLCEQEDDIDDLDLAAASVGYELVDYNEEFRLYHLGTYDTFGVISEYHAIGIGSAASSFSLVYPGLQESESTNLNDYTFERLCDYQMIYLDGFTYSDRLEAENLILRLSEAGVRIVISADGIPIDEYTGIQQFLGVSCYGVDFSNGYPLLETIDGRLDLDLFPGGYTSWKTVYLEGLDECWGYLEDKGQKLEFYGTVKNSNIVLIGLNLTYQCSLTKDAHTIDLLSHAMNISISSLPTRTIVPISISYEGNNIEIQSEYDDVNTTIAYHDNFRSEQNVWEENHLTYVNAGVSTIEMYYPYFWQGLIVSLLGVIASVLFLKWTKDYMEYKRRKEEEEDAEMIECEYNFKFYLNISHAMNINGVLGKKHSHTWEISMSMKNQEDNLVQFNDVEAMVGEFLSIYQDKYLNEMAPFDKIPPIIENVSEYFQDEIDKRIQSHGWILLRMVISETPLRAYVIDSINEENATVKNVSQQLQPTLSSEDETEEVLQEVAATDEILQEENKTTDDVFHNENVATDDVLDEVALTDEGASLNSDEKEQESNQLVKKESGRLHKSSKKNKSKISIILPVKKK